VTDAAPTALEKVCPQCGRTYGADSVFCAADGASLRRISGGEELVGMVIADRYLVLDKLGEGGMGRVYRARHVRLPQEVAIKVLSPKLVDDPDAIARFNREAANASQISNEHVARVFDFGETGEGLVYLAMEFVPGRTLRALLEAEGPLQPHRAAALVWQIADGLDAAHRRGIVHRDLKPENVIVYADDDGTECLKVVDFGIAKALDDRRGVTRTGLVIGTPEFMSPEQITGDPVDGRSDVYALALLTVVLLTGQRPFKGNAPEQVMTAHLTQQPRPLSALLPGVEWPPALQEAIDGGLARLPGERYPTAGAFAHAVVNAVDEWLAPDEATAVVTVRGRGRPTPITPSRAVTAPEAKPAPDVQPAVGPYDLTEPLRSAAPPPPAPPTAPAGVSAEKVPAGAATDPAAIAPTVAGGAIAVPEARPTPAQAKDTATPPPYVPPAPPPRLRTMQIVMIAAGVVLVGSAAMMLAKSLGGGATNDSATVQNPPAADTPVVERPQGPTVPDRTELDRRLAALEGTLHPDSITPERARSALRDIDELLPLLPTARDTVRAELRRFEAYEGAGQTERGCRVLRDLERRRLGASDSASVQLQLQAFCASAKSD
jgi:eukaryotic-like serine/threonine-protein kinase